MAETPRQLIERADWHRKRADAAHSAQTKIRLSQRPVARRGLLRFFNREPNIPDQVFDAAETMAIYQALSIVWRDEEAAAERFEKAVVVAGTREDGEQE